ncbi:zinc finger BED domain-containing protein RICESLEEPER 2 [Tanacetum coccineum]
MCTKLSEFELDDGIYSSMVSLMKKKLKKYIERISLVITYAAALNPCFNVSEVECLIESILTDLKFFDDGFETNAKEQFNDSFQGLYNIYYLKYGQPNQSSNADAASSSRSHSGNPMPNLLNKLKQNSNKKAKNDRIASSEYERYVQSDFVSHLSTEELAGYNVLGFWKTKESTFPVLSHMAWDVLSIQATSVASESAFSRSGRVPSIRRTRLTPASLEVCMCLKDHMDATEQIQHTSILENCLDFEAEILEEEVLEHEAIALSDEEVALDEAASEARMFPGRLSPTRLEWKIDTIEDLSLKEGIDLRD